MGKPQKVKTKKKKPNAMLIVERTKKRIFRYIDPRRIPVDSFEKNYGRQDLHVLGVDPKGRLWTIRPPAVASGRSPTDLFMAVNCADEVNEVYGMSMPFAHKIGLGVIVGFGIASLFIFFLIVMSSSGGTP
jgi:hypothetical protein